MFIFKRLRPQGGDRVAAPPRSCKSETLRGEAGLGRNRIKAARLPSYYTHQPEPLI